MYIQMSLDVFPNNLHPNRHEVGFTVSLSSFLKHFCDLSWLKT